ncbi:biotin--[acetyl-CoA-carboxylase] ligase [Histidinibacterium lentulum]|uniref:biotin--[biotin carboxyl-carrier protein] ligase n=1 Tax=Histidinibacterium lentulum TaxID=2480588 RepID=A0A3N2QTN2_9RHOB|nr:biotin--[acetyl-CoA-carboxylase] ligase [Histidinibacterium lentulum]ROT98499.1 biotin--[acetyl-CoA-carboxylase] ligase [Histidinibacterium lentulum]
MAEASARAGTLDAPTWILARRQTGGRGRRGNVWISGEGNFAATLLMQPACTPSEAARRSFLAANALFETLAIYVDRDALALKWPNDVLLNDGKVAGILLESSGRGPYVDWLSIGIGVNLATAPPDDRREAFRPVSLTQQGGEAVTPEEFLTMLAQHYATQERMLARLGFARVRDEWLEHAARLGEVITARTRREEITGRFETVDDEGCLVLETGSGRRTIPAADVYF